MCYSPSVENFSHLSVRLSRWTTDVYEFSTTAIALHRKITGVRALYANVRASLRGCG